MKILETEKVKKSICYNAVTVKFSTGLFDIMRTI